MTFSDSVIICKIWSVMLMGTICTIGYEGALLEDFLGTLLAAGVETLVDVRELPASRRKGFSKNKLREALEDVGIEYVHLKGLGDPKPGREAAKQGRFAVFEKIFKTHMKSDIFKADIEFAANILIRSNACLMCYERDHQQCHRKFVSDVLVDIIPSEVKHLGVREGIAKNGWPTDSRTGVNTGQSSTEHHAK
jgi:uncharacterized protein (DUF488 family)